MALEEHMQKVVDSYNSRKDREKEALNSIWKGYNQEIRQLTNLISQEFRKVLDEIGPIKCQNEHYPGTSKILEFNVQYRESFSREDLGSFRIHINKFKFSNGEIYKDKDGNCPHNIIDAIAGFSEELHPKMKAFKEKYHVSYISLPDNDCEHK